MMMNGLSSLPSSSLVSPKRPSLSKLKILSFHKIEKLPQVVTTKSQKSQFEKFVSLVQYGVILASVEVPAALAVTGENNEDGDLFTTFISLGVIAFLYLIVAPPIILNWLRVRWYKRKFLEMYLQFMFTFLFFPGLLLWAPFVNFRMLPQDPTMQYPWSTPKDDPNVPLYRKR